MLDFTNEANRNKKQDAIISLTLQRSGTAVERKRHSFFKDNARLLDEIQYLQYRTIHTMSEGMFEMMLAVFEMAMKEDWRGIYFSDRAMRGRMMPSIDGFVRNVIYSTRNQARPSHEQRKEPLEGKRCNYRDTVISLEYL